MKLIINIDGGSRGNPGPAAAGVTIADEHGKPVFEAGFHIGRATNNQAEYAALQRAVELAKELGAGELLIRSDSELLVRQMNGEYRVKNPELAVVFNEVSAQLRAFPRWKVVHVRREFNARADELANLALDAGSDIVETDRRHAPPRDATHPAHAPLDRAGAEPHPPPGVVVRAECLKASDPAVCGAPCHARADYRFDSTLPAGLCAEAGLALADAIRALRRGERAATQIPCPRPGCGATFKLDIEKKA